MAGIVKQSGETQYKSGVIINNGITSARGISLNTIQQALHLMKHSDGVLEPAVTRRLVDPVNYAELPYLTKPLDKVGVKDGNFPAV
jgi:hypothetical protein